MHFFYRSRRPISLLAASSSIKTNFFFELLDVSVNLLSSPSEMWSIIYPILVLIMTIDLSSCEVMEVKCDEMESIAYYERFYGSKCTISGISGDSGSTFVIRVQSNFDYSQTIQEIEFSKSTLYNVPPEIFHTFVTLRKVSASSCDIQELHKSNFYYATALQELRMRANKIKKIPNGAFSTIKMLENLDLTSNIISEIETSAFINLKNLEYLTLSDNKISSLNETVLKDLVSLVSIRLDSNKLRFIDENTFANNLNLSEIRLDNNEITVINGNAFGLLTKLRTLNLGSNRLQEIDIASTTIERLSIPYNKLTALTVNQKMKSLYAPYNELTELSFSGGGSSSEMVELKLRRNLITDFTNISSLFKVEVLDVSSNPIGKLNISSFARMNGLSKLNLELTNITKDSLTFGTFAHNANMTQLDISYNQLQHIDFNIFSSLSQLTHLKIDGNNLSNIPYESMKANFPKLSLISLIDNDWSCAYLSNMTRHFKVLNVVVYVYPKHRVLDEMNVDGIRCHNNRTPHVYWQTPIILQGDEINTTHTTDGYGHKNEEINFMQLQGNFSKLWSKITSLEVTIERSRFAEHQTFLQSEIGSIKVILSLMLVIMLICSVIVIAKYVKQLIAKQRFYYPSGSLGRSTTTIQTTMEHVM